MLPAGAWMAAAALLAIPAAAQSLAQFPDEVAVIEAALRDRGVGKAHRVVVSNKTATFSCSLSSEELIQLEGCSGMRVPQESVEQLIARLKRDLGAADDTLADLRAKSGQSVAVDKPFALPSAQTLWGPGKDTRRSQLMRPDVAVSVSRVGFDRQRGQAIAYVATMSWTDAAGSFGEYLLLEKAGAAWKVSKRMRVWELRG